MSCLPVVEHITLLPVYSRGHFRMQNACRADPCNARYMKSALRWMPAHEQGSDQHLELLPGKGMPGM